MPPELLFPLIMRWMHILSAVFAVGSLALLRIAVLPALAHSDFTPQTAADLRDRICRRWQMIFHLLIVLFVASGLYNYLMVTRLVHDEQPLYHALFGIKFLLAIVFFTLGIIVTSTRSWSLRLRDHRGVWALLLAVAVVIVCIGGFMRLMPTTVPPATVVEADAE